MTDRLQPDFEIVAFFASDHAEAINGKLYVNGGFWTRLNYPQYPAVAGPLALVAVIKVPYHEYQEDHKVSFGLVDADGSAEPLRVEGVFRVGASPHLRRGDPTLMPVAIPVNGLRLERPGDYSFTLSIDETEHERYPFRASQVATPLRFQLEDE